MTECTACGSSSTRRDPFFYEWKGQIYWIRRCARCTHQFVHPPISTDAQRDMYGDEYFSSSGDWVCGQFSGKSYGEATEELVTEAAEILGLLPSPPGRLLDVGCAGGVFLAEARSSGFDVLGIEINATQAAAALSRFGLDVLNSRIEDISETPGPFDVVTLLDVLEHIPQPLDCIQKLAGWIRPGGHLFIRGPMVTSRVAGVKEALRRLTRVSKRLPGYPLDANMFSRQSMTEMLRVAGFEVEWIQASNNFAQVRSVRV